MHILVVHAMVILLTLGPPKGSSFQFMFTWWNTLNACVIHSVCSQETVISTLFWIFGFLTRNLFPLPSWLIPQKKPFCCLIGWNWEWSDQRFLGWSMQVQPFYRAQNPVLHIIHFYLFKQNNMHFFPSALQDLEPQQLLLFVQSFGIPVSSMSKLLQYLDQAVSHDPQTLEQNIMDKRKTAEFEIYCCKLFRICLILYLISFYRLHGPPGGGTAWARCHWGAYFPYLAEVFSSSR